MEKSYLDPNSESIDTWAYVEIFGHDQLAGRLTTKKLGNSVMFQIDVPKDETEFSHTELFSPSSIFSIKPTTEEWCRNYTKRRSGFTRNVIPFGKLVANLQTRYTSFTSTQYRESRR